MSTPIRQLVRHGAVFGAGAILSRLASIVLLPLYTRHLTPGDYGIIAIVDLTVNLLSIAAGTGVSSAATREHCAEDGEIHQDAVWWTAAAMCTLSSTLVVVLALVSRNAIAPAALGDTVPRAALYLSLGLYTLWFATVVHPFESYLRAVKASSLLTSLSFALLLVNIALNVVMVVWMRMGVTGILWGNLVTSALRLTLIFAVFVRARGPFRFEWSLVPKYWRFGWPLMVFGALSACMHESDRYVLRLFMDLRDVGLYSLAYQIGQGVNTLVIAPFVTIWSVMVYEVARQEDAPQVYARVFRYFVSGLGLVMLGASLFADFAMRILAPPEYASAARLIPVVCLAYLFFSLHEHFKIPALLTGRTTTLLPVVSVAAIANVLLNLVFVPRFGATGAAWASVLTFMVFSFGGLIQYRNIAVYPYPFVSSAIIVAGMAATYMAHRVLSGIIQQHAAVLIVAAGAWLAWAAGLFGRLAAEPVRDWIVRCRRPAQPVVPMSAPALMSRTAGRETAVDVAQIER